MYRFMLRMWKSDNSLDLSEGIRKLCLMDQGHYYLPLASSGDVVHNIDPASRIDLVDICVDHTIRFEIGVWSDDSGKFIRVGTHQLLNVDKVRDALAGGRFGLSFATAGLKLAISGVSELHAEPSNSVVGMYLHVPQPEAEGLREYPTTFELLDHQQGIRSVKIPVLQHCSESARRLPCSKAGIKGFLMHCLTNQVDPLCLGVTSIKWKSGDPEIKGRHSDLAIVSAEELQSVIEKGEFCSTTGAVLKLIWNSVA